MAKIGKEINEPKDFIKSIYFLNIEDKTNYSESQLEEKIIEKLEYSYVKSHMIWGSNYDAMLRWALEGADAEKVTETGNGREWTANMYGNYDKISRGGYYNGSNSVESRTALDPENFMYYESSSRLILYIK